jgi:hypothetical protein
MQEQHLAELKSVRDQMGVQTARAVAGACRLEEGAALVEEVGQMIEHLVDTVAALSGQSILLAAGVATLAVLMFGRWNVRT